MVGVTVCSAPTRCVAIAAAICTRLYEHFFPFVYAFLITSRRIPELSYIIDTSRAYKRSLFQIIPRAFRWKSKEYLNAGDSSLYALKSY